MSSSIRASLAAILLLIAAAGASAQDIRLDLSSLSSWKELTFPWVPRHTSYSAVTIGGRPAIRIVSENSSSGLEYERTFNTYETPVIRWSWRVMNVLADGNAETKEGDDFAARVYIMFPYDESHLSGVERMRYGIAKRLLGYYPASEILNYVWANRPHAENPLRNVYSSQGIMYFLDEGTTYIGEWRTHEVNIVRDYRKVFRRDPPTTFTLAIMGDTDNTHGSTTAYIRGISLRAMGTEDTSR